MTFADRNALYLRTALEVLRDADGPLSRNEVTTQVHERLTFTPDELDTDDRGRVRWRVQMGFRTSEAVAVGWMTKRGGSWAITEAGLQALQDFPGTDLLNELRRQYRARDQAAKVRQPSDPRWVAALAAVELVGPGYWTTYDDIEELIGTSGGAVGGVIYQYPTASAHRVLLKGGVISPSFRWADQRRTDDPRAVLESEGVEFDERGRANPMQRMTADDFRELLEDLAPQPKIRRAWLVRGSSVEGRDLVPVWLRKESVSLAASGAAGDCPADGPG